MTHSFTIIVHGALPDSRASLAAHEFASAVLDRGNRIERVFFYHQGVAIAQNLRAVPTDEPDDSALWLALAQQGKFELAVCVAAAERRGIVGIDEQQRYALPSQSLREGFTLVGLGQLIDASNRADRTVTFPQAAS